MRTNWHRALLVSFVLIMSSLAGCIGTDDDDELEEGQYGTVMVSTYHVGEIVKAITGDTVNVEMMSTNNIPVHDYSPALDDIVRLGDADLFLYHGLGLEPWVEGTLEGLGSDAPAYDMVHTMPTGESSLDYETMLVDKLCDSLNGPSATVIHMLVEHAEDADELHGDDGAHNLGFPEGDHDDHDEDHDEHDHDDHDEDREDHDDHSDDDHDEDREDHDEHDHDDHGDREDHDDHDHGDHEMLMPEDRLQASSDCPSGTYISIYHFEAGEYMLEFEGEDVETFMMAIAQMGGAHHHHDHGDHGDDDHDDHSDDDHDDHSDDMVCYDMSTHTVDFSITTEEDCTAAGLMWTAANSGPGGDDDHGDHDEHCVSVSAGDVAPADGTFTYSDGTTIDVETGAVAPEDGLYCTNHDDHDEGMSAEYAMAMFDLDNDSHLTLEELMEGLESMEDDHDGHDDHDDERMFHCSSTVGGTPDTEIPFSQVNDGTEDCGDGSDEPQDFDGDGTVDNWFDCMGGSTISMELVNDGTDDCPEGDDEAHDDHDDDNSNYYDGCFVSTDPNDGHYECWMEDWRDEDGNLTNTDGYDEDECTELSNSTWECEHHEDDDHGDEEHHVCHNTLTHANTNDSEDSCGAYSYLENYTMGNQTFTGCYNSMTHQITWDNESVCGAYMWMEPADHGHDDHDFEHEFQEAMFEHYFNEADANSDGLLDIDELDSMMDALMNTGDEMDVHVMTEIYMSIFDEDEDGMISLDELTELMEEMMSMDDGHDDHDDHGDHDEDEDMVCYDMSTHTVDHSITTEEDCTAAGLMWTAANSGPGGDDDHGDHDDEMDMTVMAEMLMMMFDADGDDSLSESELVAMFEGMGEEHEEGVAFIGLHIEEEGEYGIALPEDVRLHVLMAGEDDGHDHGSHDDHDDHDDHAEDGHDDHAEEELAYDPHSWLDPVAMMAQVDIVLENLIEVFPEGEDLFTENANAFKAELAALDAKYETLTSNCSDRTVAANHNAYSYLAYRYDIEFVTVHGLDPEGEPSAEDVVEVVDHIKEEGITVLFVEEYTDPSSVQSIVDETGVSIETLYTMEMAPIDDTDDYLSLMNKNFDSLEAGMSCSA